jgi:DNA-binding MarR family transcriptional regulator
MSIKRGGNAGQDHLGYLLKRLSAAFRRHMDDRLRGGHSAVSMAQMGVLVNLAEEPGASGAQLARRMMISAQAISNVLRHLERDGFILRAAHPENQRRRCWQLTAKGRNELLRAQRASEPVLELMLKGLAGAERRQLLELLRRCIAALEAECTP